MDENHERASGATVHRGVSERPVNVRQTTVEGRPIRRMVSREHTLHDQVRDLRMEVSDLTIQVGDLAAVVGARMPRLLNETDE
jgi:hypothetical protein